MDKITQKLLAEVTDLHEIPNGAFSLRHNGKAKVINCSENIKITKKSDKAGLDICIKKGTKNQSLHMPALITTSGVDEVVFNDFFIEDDCEILIVAGCGIHSTNAPSSHKGIHHFCVGKNCKIRYVERHLGSGDAQKEISPTTTVNLGENSVFEMDVSQISGVSNAKRTTFATLGDNSKLLVKEKILTEENQSALSKFEVKLAGEKSKADIVSRVVAKGNSEQHFESVLHGLNDCFGRVECDGIILDDAKIFSAPAVNAENKNSALSHEAQIGRIAGEQLLKLMTLGLSKELAEQEIINGFLK